MLLRGLRLSDDLKTRLEQAQKLRGYRSVNGFILEAIEEKLQRTDAVESVSESEARIAADFSRIVREVRSVHNTQQAQYALLDALTKCALLDPRKRVPSAGPWFAASCEACAMGLDKYSKVEIYISL